MRYAGLAWSSDGYEIAIVDADGRQVNDPIPFGAEEKSRLTTVLLALAAEAAAVGNQLITVVESTNGTVDGALMISGLPVWRADPAALPDRPLLGSVPALAIAQAARRDFGALTRLELARGSQTGREPELARGESSTAGQVAAFAAAGRLFEHGDRSRPAVALTFDDGPNPPYTDAVLDVLGRYGVPATFFCIGLNAVGHAGQLRRIDGEGHQLANHTWSHPFLPDLTRPQLIEQVERAGEAIARTAGLPEPPRLLRPPYGSRTPAVMDWLSTQGGAGAAWHDPICDIVLWDVAPDDWQMPGAEVIARLVREQVQPGSVVLLHDGGGDRTQTVEALPAIIEDVLERGWDIVTAADLLRGSGVDPIPEAVCHSREELP